MFDIGRSVFKFKCVHAFPSPPLWQSTINSHSISHLQDFLATYARYAMAIGQRLLFMATSSRIGPPKWCPGKEKYGENRSQKTESRNLLAGPDRVKARCADVPPRRPKTTPN
jgi:hypothetical protein